MYGQPEPCVVVAGSGVAASALACRLLEGGFGVILLTRPGASPPRPAVIEALPEATTRLVAEIGLAAQLGAAGGVAVSGFDNLYAPGGSDASGRRLPGMWVHVERNRLAQACLTEARRRGATLFPAAAIGVPAALDDHRVQVVVDGRRLAAFAAVDATGRSARWSRPARRSGSGVAALYRGGGTAAARPGCLVGTEEGWAYRLDHPEATTVGVVGPTPSSRFLSAGLASRLGVEEPAAFVRAGTQPASVQWSEGCVDRGRLAVGDAALAYCPLAGQGVRFALSSALAAAAVLTSWREGDRSVADGYYRSFVQGARDRHLAKLASLAGAADDGPLDTATAPTLDPRRRLRFAARVERVGTNVNGRIRPDDGCVLPDGGLVRWVGGFDLLRLRQMVGNGAPVADACAALVQAGMPERNAEALLAWALRAGVVADAKAETGAGDLFAAGPVALSR